MRSKAKLEGDRAMGREKHQFFEARVDGDTAYIKLTQGLEAAVDVADVPMLQRYCWHAIVNKSGHAYASSSVDGRQTLLHRFIMKPEQNENIDHIDGDGLNNRRANMRKCSHGQNMANRVLDRRNRTGFRGVSCRNGKFSAEVNHNGKTIRLGTYATAEEAAAAQKGAAKVLWGEFAPK